jgi:signal transduction histidine kinase/CheY-like chemotaxis protein
MARPLNRRFAILIAIFAAVVACELVLTLLALDTLSGIRAYVEGESLWAKSQKQAVYELRQYVDTGVPAHYERFESHLEVTRGDRVARLELDRRRPDLELVRRGFIAGRNHPDDVPAMIRLFRRFRAVPLLDRAIVIWAEGDRGIDQLESEAQAIRAAIEADAEPASIEPAMARVEALDRDLTALEEEFSATLGEAARFVHLATGTLLVAAVLLLAALALVATRWTLGRVRAEIRERLRLEESMRQNQRIESLGRLAGGIAHDFNNLMTAVIGYSSLATLRAHDDLALRRNLEEIRRAGERAAGLTRQLLAFAQRRIVEEEVLDLNEVVRDAVGFLHPLIGEDVVLSQELADDVLPITGNRSQVEQVLINLAINARDAMAGGGLLTFRTAELDGERRAIRLEVEDTGCGMSSEVAAHAVEPFFTTKGEGLGSGLGLATVHGIVGQMGGRLSIDTARGRGTRMRIELPRASDLPRARRRVGLPQAPEGRNETVLVVEDEATVRRLTTEMLRSKRYRVLEAGCGEEAVELFTAAERRPEIVVTDVVLPGLNGEGLARRLRQDDPDLPMLFVSGYTADALRERGFTGEPSSILEKPFTPDQLLRAVRTAIDGRGRRRAAAEVQGEIADQLDSPPHSKPSA